MPETQAPAYSDEARRIADAMTLHTLAGSAGMWAAFRLDNGRERHTGTPFATWHEAVRWCGWDRDETVYLLVQPDGMQPREAESFLKYARFLHDAGHRLPPPGDEGLDAYMSALGSGLPRAKPDRYKMARHIVSGGREFPGGSTS